MSTQYTLTREDEDGNETEYVLDLDLSYEEADYEDGYCTNGGGGFYFEGEAYHNGKPFDLTEQEYKRICEYVNRNSREIERRYEPDPPDPSDYEPNDWWS